MHEELPPLGLGHAGNLLEIWNDSEAVDLLRLLGGADRFGWQRCLEQPELLMLRDTIAGIRILAPLPEMLAEGIEHLAHLLDRELPAAQAETQATGGDLPIVLARRLRQSLDAPQAGVILRVEAESAIEPARALPVDGLETASETEDHRNLASALKWRPRP